MKFSTTKQYVGSKVRQEGGKSNIQMGDSMTFWNLLVADAPEACERLLKAYNKKCRKKKK